MQVSLCVLLWALPGRQDAMREYEDQVLRFVPEHGGVVVHRLRASGIDDEPTEIQFIEFASQAGFDSFMRDERRIQLSDLRDASVARTQVLRVTQAQQASPTEDLDLNP